MFVKADDLLISTRIELGQSRHTLADCAEFSEKAVLCDISVPQPVQPLVERLMNGRGLGDPLAARKLVGEGNGRRVLDV
ncbi:hypothetical protein AKG11_33350 [Shinella sp. SUS2]|nr:hypothetical protein AKG11_33350 [Shinella sp. SUS2]KOC71416.1 hypothetical protein AKG10_33215 [Shinella sp. GWS1]